MEIRIPCRLESKRFPNKVIQRVNDRPLFRYTYMNIFAVHSHPTLVIDNAISKQYQKDLEKLNYTTIDKARNGTERVALSFSSKYFQDKVDVPIVNWQVDYPLFPPENLYMAENCFEWCPQDIVSFYYRVPSPISENHVKVVVDKNNEALHFSRKSISFGMTDHHEGYLIHVGIYVFKNLSVLRRLASLPTSPLEQVENLEQLTWLYHGFKIKMLEVPGEVLAINTEADFRAFSQILSQPEQA